MCNPTVDHGTYEDVERPMDTINSSTKLRSIYISSLIFQLGRKKTSAFAQHLGYDITQGTTFMSKPFMAHGPFLLVPTENGL